MPVDELASYRSIVVPKPDYDRVCAERDQYARAMDGLAKQLADSSDRRTATQLDVGLRAVHQLMRQVVGRTAHGMDELACINEVKAWLAVNGWSVYGGEEAQEPHRG